MTATLTAAASIANEVREAAARVRTARVLDSTAYARVAHSVIDFIYQAEEAHTPAPAPDGNSWYIYLGDLLILEGRDAYEAGLAEFADALDAVSA